MKTHQPLPGGSGRLSRRSFVGRSLLLTGGAALLAACAPSAPVEIRPPQMAVPTPLAENTSTCFNVELYSLGNNGWAWVPSGVCVTSSALN